MIEALQNAYNDEKKIPKNSGSTFIHWIAASGHIEILEDVLDSCHLHAYENIVFYKDNSGKTALNCALEAGHIEIAQKLLVAGLPLTYAGSMFLDEESRRFVLKWLNSAIVNENFDYYLKSLDDFSKADLYDVNKKAYSGLLHWAAASGYIEIVGEIIKRFTENGIPLHQKNRAKKTPVDFAKENDHHAIVELLINATEPRCFTRIPSLKRKLLEEIRQKVLTHEVSVSEVVSNYPVEVVKFLEEIKPNCLLKRALDRKFHVEEGKSPLMMMCEQNEVELVRRLIPFLTVQDLILQNRETLDSALHMACRAGAIEIVKVLMERLSLQIKNRSGLTPILCADFSKRKALVDIDKSGIFLESLHSKVIKKIRKIAKELASSYSEAGPGLWSALPEAKSAREFYSKMEAAWKSSDTYMKMIILLKEQLSLISESKEDDFNIRLLSAIKNNAVLCAALCLEKKDLETDFECFRSLVLERFAILSSMYLGVSDHNQSLFNK